eukprot:352088-Chlamydomonas_euryale.AAC.20
MAHRLACDSSLGQCSGPPAHLALTAAHVSAAQDTSPYAAHGGAVTAAAAVARLGAAEGRLVFVITVHESNSVWTLAKVGPAQRALPPDTARSVATRSRIYLGIGLNVVRVAGVGPALEASMVLLRCERSPWLASGRHQRVPSAALARRDPLRGVPLRRTSTCACDGERAVTGGGFGRHAARRTGRQPGALLVCVQRWLMLWHKAPSLLLLLLRGWRGRRQVSRLPRARHPHVRSDHH